MKEKTATIEHSVKIIYFHGFNSSPDSDTCKALQSHFGKEHIIAPAYDYINPENAFKYLDDLIKPISYEYELYFVGTSLGGFWANYFSEKYRIQCVLINPSLNPEFSLDKYLGLNENFHTREKVMLTLQNIEAYKQFMVADTPSIPKTVLLGGLDNVVDQAYTRSVMSNHYIAYAPNEGHQVKDKTLIIKLVQDALDYIGGDCNND